MKCLSLIQPWATLIAIGAKRIETRSWKTNYRGELYIHASKRIDNKTLIRPSFAKALNNQLIPTGVIIAKCKLIDCVKMTEEFISEVKAKGYEYDFGEYKVGRYGWVLENIEILDLPVKISGHLGIWNFDDNNIK